MNKVLTLGLLALGVASAQQPVRVGLAFDAGGKFDRSFNQSAYEGSQRAVKDLGVQTKDFEPSDPSQVQQGIRSFAQNGFDLTIGVGFANNASITSVAKENPDLAFGLIDDVSDAPNVASLVFKEQEGSYLVGYLAALNSATGVIGFVGGMDIPLIHRFEAGYTAGAKAANKDIRVVAQYVGTTPEAWNNPSKAKEIAGSMKNRGADVIFAAAGASGNGVIDYVKQTQCLKAAQLPKGTTFKSDNFKGVAKSATYTKACAGNSRPMFFVGVDSNQNYLGDFDKNPKTLNHGLTSMLKRVDNAVYSLIKDVKDGTFKPGERRLGLKENGVGFAIDQYNQALISKAQQDRVAKVRADIIAGKISVPTQR
ncbi:BMP family lipoprotein [Deinococcus peraridilitoris]|uniref:Putative ABC-type transport system, periplasmic component/surface lipoprotein n=1 Tax=Deinococcus peraridilitoris (strain DSM 19664 / LMG 22246 / CIP 109416 / KR-200) TaxID=937777 RepID=L0A6P2_DEIPD|nr:BMP family ABC transporter substrate-binding protein [Deinococcus peraridilitoris]AFZ69094.1 putative ABC-type transport system, periplasmic component/surface lipoprotein [Deinococcus peraridilitoris DSM 19664]